MIIVVINAADTLALLDVCKLKRMHAAAVAA